MGESALIPEGQARYDNILRKDFGLALHLTRHSITFSMDGFFQRFWRDEYGCDVEAV